MAEEIKYIQRRAAEHDGAAFIYTDRDTGRVLTILGYPTQRLAQRESE